MRTINTKYLIPVAALFFMACAVRGQSAWTDSLGRRLDMLQQLVEIGNMEKAQVDALSVSRFLETRNMPVSGAVVALLNQVFYRNKDEVSAKLLFAQAEQDAKKWTDPADRVALFDALLTGYAEWGMEPEKQRARDARVQALADLKVQQDVHMLRRALRERDSLRYRLSALQQHKAGEWTVDKEAAAGAGAGSAALLLLAGWVWYRQQRRWRQRWVRREQELELEKAAFLSGSLPAVQQTGNLPAPYPRQAELPDRVALVAEPNRPIALYLKSLLSDRFRVETVATANETLMRAGDLLPDLIICDAVLNGHSGIDVVRQLKLGERTSHIPVVLLVEHQGPEALADARRALADTWFARPLPNDDLNAQVNRLFETRRQQHLLFDRHLHLYFTEWRTQLPDPFLQRVLDDAEKHLSDPDYLPEHLARNLQLSRPHLVRKLEALTGKDPQQLIRELRLEKARMLLEKRAATPQVVSELVGFSSPGSFVKAFRDYFGDDVLLLKG